MDLDFEEMFPLLTLQDREGAYLEKCHFYFDTKPDILQKCLDHIKLRTNAIRAKNMFALESCQKKGRMTKQCCKDVAKSNDLAYNICISKIPQYQYTWFTAFILGVLAVVALSVSVAFLPSLRKRYQQKK